MKSRLLWLIVSLAILTGALYLYLSSRNHLEIDPHAAEEIKKAKRR